MSGLMYQGWNVRDWASWQTLNPKPLRAARWYAGYDTLGSGPWDLGMPEIPLDMRYADFKDRLKDALDKRGR